MPIGEQRARRAAAPGTPGGGGRSAHEVGERDVQGPSEDDQVTQVGRAVCVLPPADRLVVAPDAVAELYLGEAGLLAGLAKLYPDGPVSGEDPLGRGVVWHPTTLE